MPPSRPGAPGASVPPPRPCRPRARDIKDPFHGIQSLQPPRPGLPRFGSFAPRSSKAWKFSSRNFQGLEVFIPEFPRLGSQRPPAPGTRRPGAGRLQPPLRRADAVVAPRPAAGSKADGRGLFRGPRKRGCSRRLPDARLPRVPQTGGATPEAHTVPGRALRCPPSAAPSCTRRPRPWRRLR